MSKMNVKLLSNKNQHVRETFRLHLGPFWLLRPKMAESPIFGGRASIELATFSIIYNKYFHEY